MKLLPILVLNVVTIAIALLVYDQVQTSPGANRPGTGADSAGADPDALADRLAALEAERRRPRREVEIDPALLERLSALESVVNGPAADGNPAAEPVAPDPVETTDGEPPTPQPDSRRVTPAEIARFRALRKAVWREDAVEKNRAKIDDALDGLQIGLTAEQREDVHQAYAKFQPRINEIWGEAKAAAQETMANGGTVDRATIIADTTAVIQQTFADSLDGVVAPGDGGVIAAALMSSGK